MEGLKVERIIEEVKEEAKQETAEEAPTAVAADQPKVPEATQTARVPEALKPKEEAGRPEAQEEQPAASGEQPVAAKREEEEETTAAREAAAAEAASLGAAEEATEPAGGADAAAVAEAVAAAKVQEPAVEEASTQEQKKTPGKVKKAAKKDIQTQAEAVELKPASVAREDNLTYDLKHMAAYDIAPLPATGDLKDYTRDSVQLLMNHMFSLSKSVIEEGTVVELPMEPVFKLPRQKPVPKDKPLTRFQKFMQEKGMEKKKRSRLVFDEASGDWVPRWGYGSIKKKKQGNGGIYEVKAGEDPNSNPFEREKAEQKLLHARQKMREVRNKVEAAGGKIRASVPDLLKNTGGSGRGADGLKEALKRAQTSTGSRGKFDRLAPNEATNLQAKRQKVHHETGEKERERYMKFAGKVLSGETVDKERAAKVGNQQAEGRKAGGPKAKGVKGTPGGKRRSKQGGRKANAGRTKGRKVKA